MFDDKEFDKQFEKTRKVMIVGWFVSAGVSIGVLVFVGWVVIKLMAHFGVL